MGQYYKATFLDKNADVTANDWNPIKFQLSPYDFNEGAKLMEHSYVGNPFVQAVEYLLAKDTEGTPFVWAGDYAKPYQGYTSNLYDIGNKVDEAKGIAEIVKDDALSTFQGILDTKCYELDNPKTYKYVINHTKGLYVKIPPRTNDYVIHPLPLLTAESNGLGGGDYFAKKNAELVGSWKYDRISVGNDIPKGFKELKAVFKE